MANISKKEKERRAMQRLWREHPHGCTAQEDCEGPRLAVLSGLVRRGWVRTSGDHFMFTEEGLHEAMRMIERREIA